jgi:hypothetical protein
VATPYRGQEQDALAIRAAKKLKNEELLMVELGDVRLRHELHRVPLWRGDHVGVKQLAGDMAKYLYLPRLRDDDVLLAAIHGGVAPRVLARQMGELAEPPRIFQLEAAARGRHRAGGRGWS